MTNEQRAGWLNRPQQARSQETLDRFLDATEALLHEKRFDEITIAEIVERAERTVGSFYARFDDKTAVVKTLTARRLAAMRYLGDEMLEPSVWRDRPVRELVQTAMETLCDLFRTYGHVFRAGLTLAGNDDEGRSQRNRHYRHLAERMCGALIVHPAVDDAAEDRICLATEAVGAMMDGRLIFLRADDPRSDDDYWSATAEDLVTMFMAVSGLE